MAIFYAQGETLVTEEELNQSHAEERTPFEPIGLNKPLTIEIRHIYTGKFPKTRRVFRNGLFPDRSRDMLVTSAVRGQATVTGAARAVNVLEQNIRPHSHWSNPSAVKRGTRLVYYSPAQIDRQTDLTVEVGFDEYNEEVFEHIGNKMQQAAGIPVFASASLYLVAAGEASKLWAKIAHRLFDEPQLTFDAPICLRTPGTITATEGYALITRKGRPVDPDWLREHKVLNGELVRRDNDRPYDGDIPYVVISLDGTKRDDLKEFATSATTAGLIERFYGESPDDGNGGIDPLETLHSAMVLYNDVRFRTRADKAVSELVRLHREGAPSGEIKLKQEEFAAYVENISTEVLKPQAELRAPEGLAEPIADQTEPSPNQRNLEAAMSAVRLKSA